MTSTPQESEGVDVEPGDVAESPTKPREDGVERSSEGETSDTHTAEDAEDDPPLDADEGDPQTESYPG